MKIPALSSICRGRHFAGLLVLVVVQSASAATYDFTTNFTDQGATLSNVDFTAAGNHSLNTEAVSPGAGAYLTPGSNGTDTITLTLSNASFRSFELHSVLFEEVDTSTDYEVFVEGAIFGGGTVTSASFQGTTSSDNYAVNLSNFSGVQLTAFTVTIAQGPGNIHGTSLLSFREFSATLEAIPEPSSYAMVAGTLALGAVACRRRRRGC